jgi:hypothetical protein
VGAPDPAVSRDVTGNEGRVDPELWYGVVAANADFRSHRLPGHPVRGHWGSVQALCGEGRQRWRPVEDFIDPSAFHPCISCQTKVDDAS